MPKLPTTARSWAPGIILSATLVVAALLRFLGAGWGLPVQLNTDEWVIVLGALDLSERHSFEPAYFFRPDHLEIQINYVVYEIFARLAHGTSASVAYTSDPSAFLLLSRSITALLGVVGVALAFLIGRRIRVTVGLISAGLFAVFPPFIVHAHFAAPDVPITTVMLCVVLACMHYLNRPRVVTLLLAAFATAAAITIKYPGAIATVLIALVVIVMAVRDRRPIRILTHGAIAAAGVIGGVFLISPVLFTNAGAVVRSIRDESTTIKAGADGLGFFGNLGFYGTTFVGIAGVLLLAAAVFGVVVAIRGRRLETLAWSLGAITWVALSVVALHWDRWALPMYITPLLFAALGLDVAFRASRARWPQSRIRPWVAGMLIGVIAAGLVLPAVATTVRFLAPDTRVESREPLADLGATPANTIFEGYTTFMPTLALLEEDGVTPIIDGDRPYMPTSTIFHHFEQTSEGLRPVDPAKRFVLTSSCMHDRFWISAGYDDEIRFYEQLDDEYDVVYSISGVEPGGSTGLSTLNAGGAIGELAQYADGAGGGCDLVLYEVPGR